MARKPRFNLPGVPQHVIQRGNNRDPCFLSDEDCQRYLSDLGETLVRNDCRLHAYVLMTNHVHLLVTPMTPFGVSHLMQDLGRKYVQYVNRTYRRSGTLWEGRYKASLVDSETYLLACMRYIETNPTRANMVVHPGDYRWSSYGHNAYGRPDRVISTHPVYLALGRDATRRQVNYRELFRHHIEPTLTHAIRDAVNRDLVFGSERFKERIEEMTSLQTRPIRAGRPRTNGVAETAADYYFL